MTQSSWRSPTSIARLKVSDDAALITAVHAMRDGDRAALGDVYDLMGHAVYSLARSMTGDPTRAAAVTVATFTLMWRHARHCPTDPAQVREWAFARALASIRSQLGVDRHLP